MNISELINNIPKHWKIVKIKDVADIISGGTPKSSLKENFANPGEGIPWLTPADLSGYSNKYISHGMRDLTDVGYASCSAKLMPKDSVLFSSRAPIGYVAIAENDICTNQGFKSFVFNKKVHPVYAYYYLKHIKKIAEQMSSGTTFKELSGAKAKALPFIVTHIEEQNQIATKLDELLAQVDNIKTRLENIPAILNQFKKSVLKSAMTGELTFDWREENHTSCVKNTIENIQCYREICLGKNAKFQKHLISEEYNIPESWKWVSLDFISKKLLMVHIIPPITVKLESPLSLLKI